MQKMVGNATEKERIVEYGCCDRIQEIKDNNGNVLRVEEVEVPVLVRHYEIWRKCKHCGHLVKIFEDEKEEKYNRTMLK